MCFIGLLLPCRCNQEPERPKSRSSGHRSSHHRSSHHRNSHHESSGHRSSSHKRSHHESSDHKSSSHRRSERELELERERERSEASRQKEKDAWRDLSMRTEDAITRLCVSFERGFFEEQRAWREQERLDREQERLDREERSRLGLEREPSEKAPPYSLRDENRWRQPTPEPQPWAGVVADDSPECRNGHNRNSTGSASCCRSCVCPRCDSAGMTCPEIPELDGTRVRRVIEIESGVAPRRRRA